jgi:hypothetical protein
MASGAYSVYAIIGSSLLVRQQTGPLTQTAAVAGRTCCSANEYVHAARMVATVDRPDCMAKGTSEVLGAVSIQPMAPAPVAGLLATAALRAASRRRLASHDDHAWEKGRD